MWFTGWQDLEIIKGKGCIVVNDWVMCSVGVRRTLRLQTTHRVHLEIAEWMGWGGGGGGRGSVDFSRLANQQRSVLYSDEWVTHGVWADETLRSSRVEIM